MYFWKFFKNQGIIVWDQWMAYFEDWVEVYPKKNIWKILDAWVDRSESSKSGKNAKNANFENFLKIRVSSHVVQKCIFMKWVCRCVTLIFWRISVCLVFEWQVGKVGQKSIFSNFFFSRNFNFFYWNKVANGTKRGRSPYFQCFLMIWDTVGTNQYFKTGRRPN